MLRVRVRVIEQKCCRGDADVFTVSLELESPSGTPVQLVGPMFRGSARSHLASQRRNSKLDCARSNFVVGSCPIAPIAKAMID
jgi:hypothetical protein